MPLRQILRRSERGGPFYPLRLGHDLVGGSAARGAGLSLSLPQGGKAARRAREMQARAQHLRPEPAQRREPPEPEPSHQHGERSHERREQPSMPPVPLGPPKPPAEGIFKSLMRDSDQTLILILLLLLMENEADMELIFALMYLLI